MAPFLETVKSFADVPTDGGVDTVAFLEASEGVVALFELLQAAAFAPVVNDLRGNIKKVRTRHDAVPAKATTLQLLVTEEKAEKATTATQGLLWLLRGLEFTCKALQIAQADTSKELSAAFTEAYGVTLKQYHNFVVKGIFAVAMKACPYRKDFYAKLTFDPEGGATISQDRLDGDLNKWLDALARIIKTLQDFYAEGGYGKGL